MKFRLVWAILLLVLVAACHAEHPGHDSGEHDDDGHSQHSSQEHDQHSSQEHEEHGHHAHGHAHGPDHEHGESHEGHDHGKGHEHGESHEDHDHGPGHQHGDSHEVHHDSHAKELKEYCHGECPEFETLCHTDEYDVRRYKSALWISTTVSDPSLYQGHVRGWNRLHKYIRGGNKEGVKMPYTAPLVTQTREPQESPFHEITVSMPLPKAMAHNPPTPNDPHVVIDLVPESVMYVKKFRGRAARVGFVAEREAKKFFTALKHHHEPFHGTNDYFYIAQYDSRTGSSDPKTYNEIWVFAINERTFKWLEFNDLVGHGEGIPHCLHHDDRIGSWHKMEQKDIPVEALARRQCSETFCEAPKKCPKYTAKEVKEVDDHTIKLREEKDLKAVGVVPLTCNFDTAMHSTTGPLMEYLNETGVPLSDVAMTMTAVVEKRENEDGKEGCGKFYKVYFGMGGGSGKPEDDYTLSLNEDLFHAPKTIKVLHDGQAAGGTQFYTKCFGGNAYYEPETVTAVSKMTMHKLRDVKKCILQDHFTVIEYHSQSRLFDRFNEINVDADLDCSDQEGRPEFTFHLPLSKNYNRHEPKPVFGDRCTTYECPNMSVAMRFENNLRLMKHPVAKWLCANSTSLSCSYEQAWEKALQPILSYINGKNEDNVRMQITKPLYGQGHTGEKGNECVKSFTLCMYIPHEYTENPPKPIDDHIGIRSGDKESYWFQSVFVGKPTPEILYKSLTDMTEQLDALKPFGVDYSIDGQELWFGGYDDPGDENGLHEIIVVDQQHIYWKPEEHEGEEGEEKKEEADAHDHDWVDLPKPKGCSDKTCLEIHVTKEHDDFMEIHFPKTKGVCQWQQGCLHGMSGRSVLLPLFKYFNGDNADKEVIGDMTSPIVLQVKTYSDEEESKGIDACDREYQACARLPDAWIDQGKDIPKPNGEGMSTFDNEGADAYAISVKDVTLQSALVERTEELRQKLEEQELEFDKDWVLIFQYDAPFTPPEDKVTYVAFLKPSEAKEGDEEAPTDGE